MAQRSTRRRGESNRAVTALGALREAFARASYRVPALRSCSQAGLVNNLNDGLSWGLVPLFLAARGASVAQVGLVAAIYPAVWAVAQIATGAWSDSVGRKPLIVAGMLLQAAALTVLALSGVYRFWRDSGYALGALIAGATADALGYGGAIAIVAALTAASGIWVLVDMPRTQSHAARHPLNGDREPDPISATPAGL